MAVSQAPVVVDRFICLAAAGGAAAVRDSRVASNSISLCVLDSLWIFLASFPYPMASRGAPARRELLTGSVMLEDDR